MCLPGPEHYMPHICRFHASASHVSNQSPGTHPTRDSGCVRLCVCLSNRHLYFFHAVPCRQALGVVVLVYRRGGKEFGPGKIHPDAPHEKNEWKTNRKNPDKKHSDTDGKVRLTFYVRVQYAIMRPFGLVEARPIGPLNTRSRTGKRAKLTDQDHQYGRNRRVSYLSWEISIWTNVPGTTRRARQNNTQPEGRCMVVTNQWQKRRGEMMGSPATADMSSAVRTGCVFFHRSLQHTPVLRYSPLFLRL